MTKEEICKFIVEHGSCFGIHCCAINSASHQVNDCPLMSSWCSPQFAVQRAQAWLDGVPDVIRKLNAVALEFGPESLENAVIVSSYDIAKIGTIQNVHAPTVASPILCEVTFEVARFFENI